MLPQEERLGSMATILYKHAEEHAPADTYVRPFIP